MKYLVIAEKSEVAKAIEAALDHGGANQGDEYRVTAASGHLLELKPPEEYDENLKNWALASLPIAFENWELIPKKDNEKTGGRIKARLESIKNGLDWCDRVIHAGDPDDEGQLIVDEILDYFKNRKPVLRLDVNDSTEQYIIKMLKQMTDNAPLRPIGRSAYARTVADAIFGFNFTRYYTISYKSRTPLSMGRVQTPTLGLVVNRDKQIDSHVQMSYYVLSFTATTDDGTEFRMEMELDKNSPLLTDGKVIDPHAYDSIIQGLDGKQVPAKVSKKTLTDNPPLPFNLAELQSFCSKAMGITPEETHNVTQSLRGNAAITYNRSSCQYLHEFQHAEAKTLMKTILKNLMTTAPVDFSIKSKCFNDKYLAGEPHHAIIPTDKSFDISKLSEIERKVYKAICLYYIIQFLPPRKKEQTSVVVESKTGNKLSAVAAVTTEPGYYGYMHNGKLDDKPSPITDFQPGTVNVTLSSPLVEERKTKPPSRYTQASLIKDMTCVAKYVTDPVVKQMLLDKDSDKQKENGSIGTPATRDKIVSTLIKRGFLKEEGSGKNVHLVSTELGKSFYSIIPDEFKSPEVTAKWWQITQDIQHGLFPEDALFHDILDKIYAFLNNPPPLTQLNGLSAGSDSKVLGKCPCCKSDVSIGKYGAYCTARCGMVFSNPYGKDFTEDQVKKLLEGKTVHLTNLVSKTGNKYSMYITPTGTEETEIEKDGEKVRRRWFKFDSVFNKPVGTCPKCGGDIIVGKNGAYCQEKCGFSVNKVYGKELTENQYEQLFAGKKVLLRGLVSKSGKPYDAYVRITGNENRSYVNRDGVTVETLSPVFAMEFPKTKKKK